MTLIRAERERQVEVEGWNAAHDDEHENGEMLWAASLYYAHATLAAGDPPISLREDGSPIGWPWAAKWWKPKNRERDLVRAGALCLAEKDRLSRIEGAYRGHVDHKLSLIVRAIEQRAAG